MRKDQKFENSSEIAYFLSNFETAQIFVRSPGFPRYLPQLVDAMERGALMTTPLDLWVGSLDPSQRVVAVTGTKGKTTTTDLIGHFATEAGLRVGLAGNIGIPVFFGLGFRCADSGTRDF